MTAPASLGAQAPGRKVLVIAGLMMGILLAALDQTIVGTSLFTIASSIGGFERISWLVSAYMLASAIVIPIAGKLSDIYGRRPIYLAGMAVFLLGSALCGTAGSMTQLVVYRAIQGLGGGAIFPVALATIADLYSPSERGRIGGLFGAVFGLSSVIGPFLGGWIVDYAHVADIASWRWVFYVNVPVGIVAMAFVALFFPRVDARRDASIDYLGTATLTTALLSGLLVFALVQEGYNWTAPATLGLAGLSLAMLGAFLLVEARAKDPIIPLSLFRNPIFAVGAAASFFAGAAMFAVITFMPTYLQGVIGMSATNSGTSLIPLSLSMVFAVTVSGALTRRFGYKPWMLGGFTLAVVGYLLLWRLTGAGTSAPVWLAVVEMIILGLGIGCTLQTFVIAVQNAVERQHIGVSTGGLTLFRTLGATVGVTILGLVLNNRFVAAARGNIDPAWLARFQARGDLANLPNLLRSPADVSSISQAPGGAEAIEAIKVSFSEAVGVIFLVAASIALVALVISTFIPRKALKTAEEYHGATEDPGALVTQGH